VRRLIEAGDEPLRIVGGLAFRARSMLTAKAMLDAGASPGQVIQAARAWAYREKLERGLAQYTLEELLGFPALLLDADRSLKSRSLDPCAVLETLVERMVGSPGQGEA
jgi:DNA polymerase III delta subunit